jgi:hypothetical protein
MEALNEEYPIVPRLFSYHLSAPVVLRRAKRRCADPRPDILALLGPVRKRAEKRLACRGETEDPPGRRAFLLAEDNVPFEPDETAFDVSAAHIRDKGVHMEFKQTPAYNAKYIEAFGNLYEF